MMKIKIEDALRTYMMETGKKEIVLYVKAGSGYGKMSFLSAKARFPKKNETLSEEQGYAFAECEGIKVYYQPGELIFEENAQILINRFLGAVMLQTMGISVNQQAFAL